MTAYRFRVKFDPNPTSLWRDIIVGADRTIVEFVPATLLVPRFLAASVLAHVVLHGVRLAPASISFGDRAQRDDTILRRIGMSLVLGVLAGYTLWCVIVSVYVLTVVVHEETYEMSYYLPSHPGL